MICVANLQPRQMKFGLSEGMVTAAGGGGDEVFLLSPDSGAKPGHRVHLKRSQAQGSTTRSACERHRMP